MEGVASTALIDNGSISGHFIHLPHSICYGIHGTGKKLLNFSQQYAFFPYLELTCYSICRCWKRWFVKGNAVGVRITAW